jgi:uncharacterized protein (DUF2384 family)
MSMRSRKKEICWGVTRRRFPNKLRGACGGSNAAKVWNAIGVSVMQVFGGDLSTAWNWLNSPAIALNGMRPLDLVATGNIKSLREYLVRLKYGVYM